MFYPIRGIPLADRPDLTHTGQIALLIILMLFVGIFPASAMALPPGFGEADVVAGFPNLSGPTAVAYAPDGRTFVTEKSGRVRVVNPGSPSPSTLMNLSTKVNSYGDRGMLGIATDKDFASNGYLYLLYTYELNPRARTRTGRWSPS